MGVCIMFKTSFNGLEKFQKGIYSAYNLNQEELESLKRKFGPNSINGSNGNYTVYRDAKRQVILKLFVHDIWLPITFDIRDDLLNLYGSNKIYKDDINRISKKLKEMRIQLHVEYYDEAWHIIDYDKFLKLLKQIISEEN